MAHAALNRPEVGGAYSDGITADFQSTANNAEKLNDFLTPVDRIVACRPSDTSPSIKSRCNIACSHAINNVTTRVIRPRGGWMRCANKIRRASSRRTRMTNSSVRFLFRFDCCCCLSARWLMKIYDRWQLFAMPMCNRVQRICNIIINVQFSADQ